MKRKILGGFLAASVALGIYSCDVNNAKKEQNVNTTKDIYDILNSDKINSQQKTLDIKEYLAKKGENLTEEELHPLKKKLENIEAAKKDYENLKKHIGKEIYIITVEEYPGEKNYYYISKEKYKKDLLKVKSQEKQENNFCFKTFSGILDNELFEKIIKEKATSPLTSTREAREFYSEQAKERGIPLD